MQRPREVSCGILLWLSSFVELETKFTKLNSDMNQFQTNVLNFVARCFKLGIKGGTTEIISFHLPKTKTHMIFCGRRLSTETLTLGDHEQKMVSIRTFLSMSAHGVLWFGRLVDKQCSIFIKRPNLPHTGPYMKFLINISYKKCQK